MGLAGYAMDVRETRGRRFSEPPHAYRNDYARDRDRIIHSRAFRRLEAKTQVFTTRFSDHFRNRLTHTLEVTQMARTVAGALDLNSDLAEALALVHDIGHPPFGHAGEQRLDERMRAYGEHFEHNRHALRIVEWFEQRYLDFPGLNLTFEVREGIIKHSREYSAVEFPELSDYLLDQRPPLEAQLIDRVDEIAYNTADLDDGYEAHLLDIATLREKLPAFREPYDELDRRHPQGREKLKFNEAMKRMLNWLVTDLIDTTRKNAERAGLESVEDVRRQPARLAAFSEQAAATTSRLKQFLFARLYNQAEILGERERSIAALDELFTYYLSYPERMPKYYAEQSARIPVHRVVCDYIAGMTDQFLLRQHREHVAAAARTV